MSQTAWIEKLRRAECLPPHYSAAATEIIGPLAARVGRLQGAMARPVVIGICGAQGSGKTTMARFLACWLEREPGLAATCLSLDDFYLGRAARGELARTQHPLFRTRGVPGTHDVGLARRLLEVLTGPNGRTTVAAPVFDKARDDVLPVTAWRPIEAPVDVVLFEGWCVGVRPQGIDLLRTPANALEAVEDADGRWRRAVNDRLGSDYRDLFGLLDALVMLRIPSFDKVLQWRILQERKRREKVSRETRQGASADGMTDAQLARFVMHFERLTRHALETMPAYADTVIDIDAEHRMTGMSHRGRSAGARHR